MQGYTGSILAYGQTGTGKTYTMIGDNDGILPMSVFYMMDQMQEKQIELKIGAIQVYNEQVRSLFSCLFQNLKRKKEYLFL